MMNRRFHVFLAAMAALLVFWPIEAFGEERDPTVKIVLHPMAAPRPALKYQLLPPFLDRRPGNAIVHYLKLPHEQWHLYSDDVFWKTVGEWQEMPLPELRKALADDKVKRILWITSNDGMIWEFLERGSRCESADWDFPLREHEHTFWNIRLPDVQAARVGARFLAPRARVQIAEGKYDEAIKTFQVGFALGRHVGDQGSFLVQALVGMTIAGIMSDQVLTFVQQPGAPNLYWAFESLPKPFISIHRPMEVEAASMYLNFPELRDIDNKTYSPEQWRQLMDKVVESLYFAQQVKEDEKGVRKLGIMANVIAGYPKAKQALIAWGRSAEEVEAMPVAQVVLIYTMHVYDELRDDQFKWLNMPYARFESHSKQMEQGLHDSIRSGREIIPLAATFLPAVLACKTAETRMDRDLAALQLLEALRMYGASHDGQLPEHLKDVIEVPVPPDPFTGEAFVYRRQGDRAVLESQYTGPIDHSTSSLRYEIRFAEKEEK